MIEILLKLDDKKGKFIDNHLSLFLTAFSCTSELTMDRRKYPTIKMIKTSHNRATNGLLSWKVEGWWRTSLWAFKDSSTKVAKPSLTSPISWWRLCNVSFLNMVMTKSIWMWTLIIAFPINVAVKNFRKEIRKCPHVMPARSKRGFGIDAHKRIVMNPYLYKLSKITIFALSIKLLFSFLFSTWI